ncbi:MAG TPA: pentapeptide repeat-containing protein [Chthoniobacterales bacterium]|nr:pentapeptide repeat-containing protein [Chthoniobacterales bacterium]
MIARNVLAATLFALENAAGNSTPTIPAEAFPIPAQSLMTSISDDKRREILAALASPDRDELLRHLGVTSQIIADQTWFDLSGIEVGPGELPARANVKFICWDGAHIVETDLSGADFDQALLRYTTFDRVNLRGAHFDGSTLDRSDFVRCDLRGATFRGASLGTETKFRECNLNNSRFDQCKAISSPWFYDGTARHINFDRAVLPRVKFTTLDASGATFRDAHILDSHFYGSVLDDIDFSRAHADKLNLRGGKLSGTLRLVDTHISRIFFGDLDVSRVDVAYARWSDYRVGEEDEGDEKSMSGGSDEALIAYVQAERIYRTLSEKLRQSGYISEYLGLRFRACETRRKILALDREQGRHLERCWLFCSKYIDGYGTRPWVLGKNALILVFGFALIYTFGMCFANNVWFRWFRAKPQGAGYLKTEQAEYSVDRSRRVFLRPDAGFWQRLGGLLKAFGVAIGLSVEASFIFGEKLINIPNILELFHAGDEHAVPFGIARRLFATQAALGLLFFLLAGRMILLLVTG